LGLHNDAGICKIYCNRQHKCLWYTFDGEVHAVTAKALTGYLRELKFEKCDRRGKEVYKLLATLEADRLYVLESGHDTHFAKGLMSAVASLTPQQLQQPITIQPQPGTDDKVLFCRVFVGAELVMAHYDERTDFRAVAKRVIALVKGHDW